MSASNLSARGQVRFVPSEYDPDDPAATAYLVAVPSYQLRAVYRHALFAAGLRYPPDAEIFRIMRAAIAESGAANAADLLALVEAGEARLAEPKLELPEGTLDRLADLQNALMETSPAYARALASRAKFNALSLVIAAKLFLRGWENVKLDFRRGAEGVPDELIEQLPEAHLGEIGAKAIELMTVSETQAKNSVSPSKSHVVPATSTAANVRPTAAQAGSSSENSTN